ncbi:hypothetical protein [Pinibacter aurantiacus]|uniref:Uncharacterized protein n=1 Tax=Pinibacter aurantiacus TaxID=2851599 RepID=A0A9E2SD04_9BACT|nr:hypothetical protein [Pinibacter aurantiacus]MBV4357580.1 hypothetical protein [Pinibacter aurantiacus]
MWTLKNLFAIGGLENVGFAPGQDKLIVLSSQGQGIFDCNTGEKIARKHDGADWWNSFNEPSGSIPGFDCLEGLIITTHGLYGDDNLPKSTTDGWTLSISKPEPDDKPFEKYLIQKIHLISPDKEQKIFIAKDGACEFRAFGFSETGKSFIVASSCDLIIYSR